MIVPMHAKHYIFYVNGNAKKFAYAVKRYAVRKVKIRRTQYASLK